MAIAHFSVAIIARGSGRSAVMSAAYRHCARMEYEREAKRVDYSRKSGLVHEEFSIPTDAAEWVRTLIADRSVSGASEVFWNRVENFERRSDAQLAKDLTIALPRELGREQNIALIREFVATYITAKGMVADWVYHEPGNKVKAGETRDAGLAASADLDNPHIHLMVTLRPLSDDGFGAKKVAVLSDDGRPLRNDAGKIVYEVWAGGPDDFETLRDGWFSCQNRHLALAGLDIRIDGRSFAKRGIALVPSVHIGVAARAIERKFSRMRASSSLERVDLQDKRRAENARRILSDPRLVLDLVTRERSVFDERDLAKVVSRYIDDVAAFQGLMARLVQDPQTLILDRERFDFASGNRQPARYTTREMIVLEADMVARASWLSGRVSHPVDKTILDRVFAAHDQLSVEQRAAIEHVVGRARIAAVVGRAGAGKTTMMRAAREAWEHSGYRVVGAALAGKAAEGLEKEAGIRSLTLSSWQLRWQNGLDRLDEKTVFVLDEAGMVASRQMAYFVKTVSECGAKLVLVGDPEQLQPIEAGAAFRAISERIGYAELETIYRQREQWMRDASLELARGHVERAIDAYGAAGRLIGAKFKAQASERLIADWLRDYDPQRTTLILAHLRRDVRLLNERARAGLVARGLLTEGSGFVTSDGVRHFATGDQVVFLRNERALNVKNGMLGKVIEARRGALVVDIGDGQDIRRIAISQQAYNDLDHGYATTIHKAQGATVDRVKLLATLSLDRHLTYVAMTRHRIDLAVYFGEHSFARNGGLSRMLARRNAKSTTLDYAARGFYGQALRFARARGFNLMQVARMLIEDRLAWILSQKQKVIDLSGRLEAVRASLWPPRTIDHGDSTEPLEKTPMVPGLRSFMQSIDAVVDDRLAKDPVLTALWGEVSMRLQSIYVKPEAAVEAMGMETLLASRQLPERAADLLNASPEAFGTVHGRAGLLASRLDRQRRELALKQVPLMVESLRDFIEKRSETEARYRAEEEALRRRLSIDIPALSPDALRVLEKVFDALDRNDLAAGLGFALADKLVKAELDRLTSRVAERFGPRSLLGHDAKDVKGEAFRKLSIGMNGNQKDALRKAWTTLRAVQQLAAHERQIEERKEAEKLHAALGKGLSLK